MACRTPWCGPFSLESQAAEDYTDKVNKFDEVLQSFSLPSFTAKRSS